jgi:Regulator of chromosome condensation (RCC1) repeat
VIKVTVGSNSACALLVSGAARCWGFNTSGDLGNGTAVDSHIPVNVHLI